MRAAGHAEHRLLVGADARRAHGGLKRLAGAARTRGRTEAHTRVIGAAEARARRVARARPGARATRIRIVGRRTKGISHARAGVSLRHALPLRDRIRRIAERRPRAGMERAVDIGARRGALAAIALVAVPDASTGATRHDALAGGAHAVDGRPAIGGGRAGAAESGARAFAVLAKTKALAIPDRRIVLAVVDDVGAEHRRAPRIAVVADVVREHRRPAVRPVVRDGIVLDRVTGRLVAAFEQDRPAMILRPGIVDPGRMLHARLQPSGALRLEFRAVIDGLARVIEIPPRDREPVERVVDIAHEATRTAARAGRIAAAGRSGIAAAAARAVEFFGGDVDRRDELPVAIVGRDRRARAAQGGGRTVAREGLPEDRFGRRAFAAHRQDRAIAAVGPEPAAGGDLVVGERAATDLDDIARHNGFDRPADVAPRLRAGGAREAV